MRSSVIIKDGSGKARLLNWRPGFRIPNLKPYKKTQAQPPDDMDLRPNCSPVLDQGQFGSCSGNAGCNCVDFGDVQGTSLHSRLFLYRKARVIEGDAGTDAGVQTLGDICTALQTTGVCLESLDPYAQADLFSEPSPQAFENAFKNRIPSFTALENNMELIDCLASGQPFMFGIPVYQSFMDATNGVIPMPNPQGGDEVVGGHALMCCGYHFGVSGAPSYFIFKNSWGTDWGMAGYGYLPMQYMQELADDFYTIQKGA